MKPPQKSSAISKKSALAACVFSLVSFSAGISFGASEPSAVRLYVVQQPLATVFETLGSLAGVSVLVDPTIEKIATRVNLSGGHTQVFAQLAKQYNLFYWYDGNRYNIYQNSNLSKSTISTDKISNEDVRSIIQNVAPYISNDAINFNQELRVITVIGPRDLKETIEKAMLNFNRDGLDPVSIIRFGITTR